MADKNSAFTRLARAYPAAFKAEVERRKPLYDVTSKESALNHFRDATNNTMGRAIMAATLLDQCDSGEVAVEATVRARVAEIFEEAFNELANV